MFPLMNEHKFEINITPDEAPTYARLAKGISNVEPDNNEETAQDKYLDGGGFGETDVISAQLILTFTAHRDYTDPAQNYIFGKLLALGANRRTDFRWTEPDGGVFTGPCTIATITGPSGDAGAKGEVSWEIHFDGMPVYTPTSGDAVAPTVTVSPIDAATAVPVNSNIVWTFNEAINPSYAKGSCFFVTKQDGTEVAGTLTISSDNKTVTFNPNADLSAATQYIAIATKSVADLAGNNLAANSVTNFATA